MKDYYEVLGIARDESSAGIHARYRDVAAQPHSESSGEAASLAFQEVVEAHTVLSDTSRKHAYDERLNEFYVEQRRTPAGEIKANSVLGDAHGVHPSFEALYERIMRNFTGCGIPKGERSEALRVNVEVVPEDAAAGGVIPIGIPIYEPCPVCRGMTTESFFRCLHCDGDGIVEEIKTLAINLPARVTTGSISEVSLGNLGIHNLFLRVCVAVSR
jgi:molecular chaperone DnaJ